MKPHASHGWDQTEATLVSPRGNIMGSVLDEDSPCMDSLVKTSAKEQLSHALVGPGRRPETFARSPSLSHDLGAGPPSSSLVTVHRASSLCADGIWLNHIPTQL